MTAALPPCWNSWCGFAAFGRFLVAALPLCGDNAQWDTGGDGHRRILAKHGDPV